MENKFFRTLENIDNGVSCGEPTNPDYDDCTTWKENTYNNTSVGKCPADCIGKDFNKG